MDEAVKNKIEALGPWFHNLELDGNLTAPCHFLGDYPSDKWARMKAAVPEDLTGKSVLDIGCNGGFYSLEMKRRGAARVVAIDSDDHYLRQAKFAAEVRGVEIEFHKLSVYDIGALGEQFDLVLFLGVLYHLRHPLLALDLIHRHGARNLMLFQCMQRGSREIEPLQPDYDFFEPAPFDAPGFPKLHFVEQKYSGDLTNWWIPNRACVEAMLRSAGFEIDAQAEEETYLCRRVEKWEAPHDPHAVYPAQGPQPHG